MFNYLIPILDAKFLEFRLRHCKNIQDVILRIGEPDISFPPNLLLLKEQKFIEFVEKYNLNLENISLIETLGEQDKRMVHNWYSKYRRIKIQVDEFEDGSIRIILNLGFASVESSRRKSLGSQSNTV